MAVLSDRLTANGLRVLGGGAILAAIVALIAHFAFASEPGPAKVAATTPSASASTAGGSDSGTGGGDGSTIGAGDSTANPNSTGGSTNNGGSGGRPNPTTAPPTGPWIQWFKITNQPKCTWGQSTINVTIAWKVTGADSVALSVDNPGIVGSYRKGYKLEDSQTLTLGCANPPEKHIWTIYTVGGGPQRSATINAQATPAASPSPTPSTAKTPQPGKP